jgi:hypothetical protein
MRGWLVILAAALAQAQPDTSLESKITARVAENLKGLPNYTCGLSIERFSRKTHKEKFERLDTVRVEVAYVDGQELFGWPGAGRIEESQLSNLVSGTIGTGDFAGLVAGVFRNPGAVLHSAGETELAGRRALRYDYDVPQNASERWVRTRYANAIVAYHGSFWVDPATLDLIELDAISDVLPKTLLLVSTTDRLKYARVAFGTSSFLLPQAGDLELVEVSGRESRNTTRFQSCRQFVGESVLSFADPPPEPAAPPTPPAIAPIALPDDFLVSLRLETPVESTTSAQGDVIQATLEENIQVNHAIVVPKRAKVSGYVARLERPGNTYQMDLVFTAIDFEGGHVDLSQRENHVMQGSPRAALPNRVKLARGAHLILRSRLVKF